MKLKQLKLPTAAPLTVHVVGLATFLTVAAGFYYGLYRPNVAEAAYRAERMEHLRALTAGAEKIAAEHEHLTHRLADLKKAVASTRLRMPRRASAHEFMEQATRLAETYGLALEQISATPSASFPTHRQIEVACRLKGSYAAACKYLSAVDQFTQLAKVSHLEIDSAKKPDAYPIFITFQLYYRAEAHDTEQRRGTP